MIATAPDSSVSLAVERFTFPANVEKVQVARERFLEFLRDHGASEEDLQNWVLVFTEASNNAVIHGAKRKADNEVMIEWWPEYETKSVCLAITDPGEGPPQKYLDDPKLPDDPLAEGGRGLFIINEICDSWRYWRGPEGFRIELRRISDSLREAEKMVNEEFSEELLAELSVSYENLAAYSRLGAALVEEKSPSGFMEDGLGDLLQLHQSKPDLIMVCITEVVRPELSNELNAVDAVKLYKESPKRAQSVMDGEAGFTWMDPKDIEGDEVLSKYGCGCCFPIVASGKTLGCLIAAKRESNPLFKTGELNNLRTFADLFGIAIANANLRIVRDSEQRSLREFEIATEIQKNLLPINDPPEGEDWELFLRHLSASEVAGDYVEAVFDRDGNLFLSILDVMGKGVSAAMLATIYRTAFHMKLQSTPSLEELIITLNRTICEQLGSLSMFLTCCVCRIERDTHKVEIVNAGHCPTLVLHELGVKAIARSTGPPLGLFLDADFQIDTVEVREGECILLVTDGLYEWSHKGEMFGWANLVSFAAEMACTDPDGFWNSLRQKIEEQRDPDSLNDDQTMLLWRYKKL